MKKNFSTIKNLILLIASALTLVAVTFAWYSVSKTGNLTMISKDISGSTLSATFYYSEDYGSTYKKLNGDISMENMTEGEVYDYRIDVKTFKGTPIKLIFGFDNLNAGSAYLKYIFFNYRLICNDTGTVISSGNGLSMNNYKTADVFAEDLSALQAGNKLNYSIYYEVYVQTNGEPVSGSASLGNISIQGQQIG